MAHSNDNYDDDDSLFDEESDSGSTRGTPETKRRRILDENVVIAVPAETNQNKATAEESNNNNNGESLHSLISKHQWDCVIQRVQQLRAQHPKKERIPELHEKEPDFHMTPLYAALTPEHAAPASVIDALLDSYTAQDEHALLQNPLLSACALSDAENVITRMLQYKQSLVLGRDDRRMNVLHVVLQQQPSLKLVQLLVTAWAQESCSTMEHAWTQLLSTYDGVKHNNKNNNNGHGVLPIHCAIEHHSDTSVILQLLEQFPKSASMTLQDNPDNPDVSTVHHAVFHGCSYPVLKALIHHYGPLKLGDAGTTRNKKDTPLHFLFHPEKEHLWQQTTTNNNCMPRYKMAWYLIQQYSTTLKSDFGVKKGNKTERAHKLVFEIKGTSGQSVYQMAVALAETNSEWKQLSLLMRDLEHTILHYSREWPLIDYTTNELEE